MNFDQFTKRYNQMFPDNQLAQDTKDLGMDAILVVHGEDKNEIIEKMSFSLTMSICSELKDRKFEIVDDLTDGIFSLRAQVVDMLKKNVTAGEKHFTVAPRLFVKNYNSEDWN